MGARRPVERAVNLFVYAPLGLLFEAPRLLPRLVERGRQEADSMVRTLGLRRDDEPVLSAVPDAPGPVEPPPDAERAPVAAVPSGPDPETLAIPDYESLSASQVVPRLEGLSSDELEAVKAFELGNRHRSTILNKIAQLQAG